MMKSLIILLLASTLLACSATSHIITGQQRDSIAPHNVTLFTEPPADYEEIAILQASSRNSWAFTEQGKMDKTIQRLKAEAASLGANGVIIKQTGTESSGYVNTGAGNVHRDSNFGITVGLPLTHATAEAIAIWVNHLDSE